jgi:hypothetical protein
MNQEEEIQYWKEKYADKLNDVNKPNILLKALFSVFGSV